MGERSRFYTASFGFVLWFAYPIAFFFGSVARREHRCGDREFTGEFDDCFNDYLPILELVFVPAVTLVFAFLFAVYAYSMFAPDDEFRSKRWWFAASGKGADYHPGFLFLVVIGLTWTGFHVWGLPVWGSYWYLWLYWLGWIGWFAAGGVASHPCFSNTEK